MATPVLETIDVLNPGSPWMQKHQGQFILEDITV